MEKVWLKSYPSGMPETIDVNKRRFHPEHERGCVGGVGLSAIYFRSQRNKQILAKPAFV